MELQSLSPAPDRADDSRQSQRHRELGLALQEGECSLAAARESQIVPSTERKGEGEGGRTWQKGEANRRAAMGPKPRKNNG